MLLEEYEKYFKFIFFLQQIVYTCCQMLFKVSVLISLIVQYLQYFRSIKYTEKIKRFI